ncbi:hypothetical protein C9374_001906 [Naegleria lovaniensis]|uniref:adenosine deaminase n=1 Tax=Naegleria lovaniensis TaxID=51637 RepID=A0AA88GVY6_NAELO|nr:uncharacterized protein C9374_001906 [Naegleria lovaniensis]KAG2386871.1 hypothetical protein C9374_001906 [Naegleria lovaniensis]
MLIEIPKAELHRHLDGSLRIQTMIDLANRYNINLPAKTENELSKHLVVPDDCASLEQYLEAFKFTCAVLQNEYSLERVTYEVCEDAYKENTTYLEIRFGPVLHTNSGLSLKQIMDSVVRGVEYAERTLPGFTGRIIIATKYSHAKTVAFDLASKELEYPASLHRKSFQLVHENYLMATCHSGEAAGSEYIKDAIINCGVQRIGHGTKLVQDLKLLEYVRARNIALEICVTSNFQTKATPSYAAHPLPFYFRKGIAVCVCTDNTLMSDITLSKELFKIQRLYNFTNEELLKIMRFSFENAFISYSEKAELLRTFDEYVHNNFPKQ